MRVFLLIMIFMALTAPMRPAEKKEPILRVDTGGHKGIINDIVVTRDKRFIVSASHDKTIRVWNVETGREERKILGQIAGGPKGKIFAIALSPDNTLLAVGGFLDKSGGDGYGRIRIYNFPTGKLRKILKGHTSVVNDLAFSGDGKYLVSGSHDNSVKIWNMEDFTLHHTILEHTSSVYGTAIFKKGAEYRVVSVGNDKKAVLYSLTKKNVLNTFAADVMLQYVAVGGDHIACCDRGRHIYIFDLFLQLLRKIPSPTKPAGLTFSGDGKLLLAGTGGFQFHCIIYNAEENFTVKSLFKKHDNTTQAVAFLNPHTAVTGGGANNDINLWDAGSGKEKKHIKGAGKTVWAVGIKENTIAYANTGFNKLETSFDLSRFKIGPSAGEGDFNHFNRISKRYLDYSLSHQRGGAYNYQDAVLVIKKGEKELKRITRGATDGLGHNIYGFSREGVIISGGSNGFLTAYDLGGRKKASFIGHTGEVWSIATENDLLVSGSNDQTIKLWNLKELEQGKTEIFPILNIFIGDNNEWVVWSQSGYYNSSIGGDKYIGFHVNQGDDKEALFYNSDQYYQKYYRPDIIKNIVYLKNETKAIAYANTKRRVEEINPADMLPPLVEIDSPSKKYLKTHKDFITVHYTVTRQSQAAITAVTVLVNGSPLKARGITIDDGANTMVQNLSCRVPLLEKSTRIDISARNRYAESNPAYVVVTKTENMADRFKPSLYILAVGVSRYANPLYNLRFAHKDAEGITAAFKKQEGKVYRKVEAQLLPNEKATRVEILQGINWLYRKCTQNDIALVFLAGHGEKDERGNFYFMAHDADKQALSLNGVKWSEFIDLAKDLPAKMILMADTCHSGAINGKGQRGGADITAAIKSIKNAGKGRIIMTASTGDTPSWEKPGWGHGAFSKAVIDGIGLWKADRDGNSIITIKELDWHVTTSVAKLTGGKQKPTTIVPESVPDFAVAAK
ncbi:MAG: peptidase C14 [bacterium]|nr:peptidase C14 [bacterium]